MSFRIGRGRYAGENYPEVNAAAGAATAALRNRNVVTSTPLSTSPPFVPDVSGSLIAAIAFTPKVSGVVQVSAEIALTNGVDADTYSLGLIVLPGTGLSVNPTSGEVVTNGWVMGSNTPPVFSGTPGAPALDVIDTRPIAGNATGNLETFGISDPLPIGVPSLILVELAELGGSHSLATLIIVNLTVMELP